MRKQLSADDIERLQNQLSPNQSESEIVPSDSDDEYDETVTDWSD